VTANKKRNAIYWTLKALSVFISCALPILGIIDQFPIWKESSSTGRSVGAGIILIAVIVLIVFNKSVFAFLRDRLRLNYAPPLMIWLVLIVMTWGLMWLSSLMEDMMNIYILGFVGCLIGNVLTFIGEHIRKDGAESD